MSSSSSPSSSVEYDSWKERVLGGVEEGEKSLDKSLEEMRREGGADEEGDVDLLWEVGGLEVPPSWLVACRASD